MIKYIQAAASLYGVVSIPSNIEDVISVETLNPEIMDTNAFYFSKDFMYLPADETRDDRLPDLLEQFGMVLKSGYWFISGGMKFSISKEPTGRAGRLLYCLHRNGADIKDYHGINDYYGLNVSFTPFGFNCYSAAEDLGRPFKQVVADMLVYKTYFNIQ
jgi:hypothetical protein